jgi:Domain of unknown function (DUF4326)
MPPNTVVVSRPTKWGNPFRMEYHKHDPKTHICIATRAEQKRVVNEFAEFVARPGNESLRRRARRELRGKNLACWCALDAPCHADVLLRLANARTEPRRASDK